MDTFLVHLLSSCPRHFLVAGILATGAERSAKAVAEGIWSGFIRISVAASRPKVVSVHTVSPSLISQSIPLTLTHLSVVGPGTLTPQRRINREGSPHAAVAWLLVLPDVASPTELGRATIIGAHAGFAASFAEFYVHYLGARRKENTCSRRRDAEPAEAPGLGGNSVQQAHLYTLEDARDRRVSGQDGSQRPRHWSGRNRTVAGRAAGRCTGPGQRQKMKQTSARKGSRNPALPNLRHRGAAH